MKKDLSKCYEKIEEEKRRRSKLENSLVKEIETREEIQEVNMVLELKLEELEKESKSEQSKLKENDQGQRNRTESVKEKSCLAYAKGRECKFGRNWDTNIRNCVDGKKSVTGNSVGSVMINR